MSFIKRNKYIIIFITVCLVALTIAFFKDARVSEYTPANTSHTQKRIINDKNALSGNSQIINPKNEDEITKGSVEENNDQKTEKENADLQFSIPKENNNEIINAVVAEEKQHNEISENNKTNETEASKDKENLTCTLSVRCDTIRSNINLLNPDKRELICDDYILLPEQQVVFYEGESVFNVLLREMKKNKIHMEYEFTPLYDSAYIKGIGNIYEHDCGELSGWVYKVNKKLQPVGCSEYILKDNDIVEWLYSCDLGRDI